MNNKLICNQVFALLNKTKSNQPTENDRVNLAINKLLQESNEIESLPYRYGHHDPVNPSSLTTPSRKQTSLASHSYNQIILQMRPQRIWNPTRTFPINMRRSKYSWETLLKETSKTHGTCMIKNQSLPSKLQSQFHAEPPSIPTLPISHLTLILHHLTIFLKLCFPPFWSSSARPDTTNSSARPHPRFYHYFPDILDTLTTITTLTLRKKENSMSTAIDQSTQRTILQDTEMDHEELVQEEEEEEVEEENGDAKANDSEGCTENNREELQISNPMQGTRPAPNIAEVQDDTQQQKTAQAPSPALGFSATDWNCGTSPAAPSTAAAASGSLPSPSPRQASTVPRLNVSRTTKNLNINYKNFNYESNSSTLPHHEVSFTVPSINVSDFHRWMIRVSTALNTMNIISVTMPAPIQPPLISLQDWQVFEHSVIPSLAQSTKADILEVIPAWLGILDHNCREAASLHGEIIDYQRNVSTSLNDLETKAIKIHFQSNAIDKWEAGDSAECTREELKWIASLGMTQDNEAITPCHNRWSTRVLSGSTPAPE